MKPELLLTIGLPASRKTTYAKAWLAEDPDGRIRVNYDELRVGMFGPDWIWNRKDEEHMKAAALGTVKAALKAGYSVVVDNTNLSRHVRRSWQDVAHAFNAEFIEHEMDASLEECVRDDRLRDATSRVGQAVIDKMAAEYGFLDWNPSCLCPQAEYSDGFHRRGCPAVSRMATAKIAIVDIDGTVADCSKRLHHIDRPHLTECSPLACHCGRAKKDWNAFFAGVYDDKPIVKMLRLLERLETDHLLVFVSGRPISSGRTKVGILTEDWLRKYLITPDRLFLRQTNDHQPDFEFKKAVLDYIPKDRIAYVFEDRDQCVRMYRDELKKAGSNALVMQVADGSY